MLSSSLLVLALSVSSALATPFHSPRAAEQPLPGVAALRFPRSSIPTGKDFPYDPDRIALDRDRAASKYKFGYASWAANEAAARKEKRSEESGGGWYRRRNNEPLDLATYRDARLTKRQSGVMPVYDSFGGTVDSSYFSYGLFGTPGQNLSCSLDTGSADLWVPGPDSPSRHSKFNGSSSSTYQGSSTQWEIQYGSGAAEGTLATDTVTFAGLTVREQVFALSETTVRSFESQPSDGLLGMGFSTIAQSRAPTFVENLISTRAIADTVFQISLQRAYDITGSNNRQGVVGGGELLIGGIDSGRYTGSVGYSNVLRKGFWEIQLDGIALNGSLIPSSSVAAAIDSGTSLIYLPAAIARSLFTPLNGLQQSDGSYVVPCNNQPLSIALQFGGVQYTISSDDLFLGYANDPRYCMSAIMAGDTTDPFGNPVAIVGDTFLKNVASIYDYGGSLSSTARVGFATAVESDGRNPTNGVVGGNGTGSIVSPDRGDGTQLRFSLSTVGAAIVAVGLFALLA